MSKPHNPRIICKDGYSLSAQASRTHYSIPRDDVGPYTHVEIGYPEDGLGNPQRPEAFAEYQSGGDPVYAFVPLQVLIDFVDLHGGVRDGAAEQPLLQVYQRELEI